MSVYDEILDAILWIAEQEGKGKEAKKVYDRIKRRDAIESKKKKEKKNQVKE